jgi:regulator of cell morphogenesis and NO signaling
MNNIDINKSLGDLVTDFPAIVSTMNKYKIDYCCGGKDKLKEAIIALDLNELEVMKELELSVVQFNETAKSTKLWGDESMNNIIDFILNTHHVFMKETLGELNFLMFKILKVHFRTEGETLLKVHSLFGQLKTELEAHLVKEEENLFPMILEYEKSHDPGLLSEIRKYINETESEHDTAGDVFKELETITDNYTAPDGACPTFLRTYNLLNALEKDTFNHIHMENSILFGKL